MPEINTTVKALAERLVLDDYYSEYRESLLALIPGSVLDTTLSDENIVNVSEDIDRQAAFPKHNEMAKLLGLGEDWGKDELKRAAWKAVVNSPLGSLPLGQENLRREIAFLFGLSASVAHQ